MEGRPPLALLMFNYNENGGINHNIELLMDIVDEILIIDSSDIGKYNELSDKYKNIEKVRIIRMFPIGYVEPFRMYALKKIASDWVLYLDADEGPNQSFINNLKNIDLKNASAYTILRYEETLKCYDYQLRLYKKDSIVYNGMIHEIPPINGIVKEMDKQCYIIHHADFSNYLKKRGPYLTIEAYERPFTASYLSTQSPLFNLFRNKNKILGRHTVTLLWFLLFLRSFNINSIKYKTYRNEWFLFKYTLTKYKYFVELSNRDELIKINKGIIKNNGIIKYLNLDDVDYVENLTNNFKFDKKGITIFEELVNYRYYNNKFKDEI